MRTEDITKFLQGLGLTEYEAKTYAALSISGRPMRAGDISKSSGVPQSKVYGILEELTVKQLVEVSEGKPKEYRAVESEMALKRLVEEKEKSVKDVKVGLKEISTYLKPVKQGETMSGIWTAKGKNWVEFFNKASDMIDHSRKYVYGVTRDFSRSAKLSEIVQSAVKRGVKVRVIGMQEINEENYFKAKWFLDNGAEIRSIDTSMHPRIVLIDGKEVLLRLDHDQGKKDGFPFSSVWSGDPSLVKVFDTYVRNLWDGARPVDLGEVEKSITN